MIKAPDIQKVTEDILNYCQREKSKSFMFASIWPELKDKYGDFITKEIFDAAIQFLVENNSLNEVRRGHYVFK